MIKHVWAEDWSEEVVPDKVTVIPIGFETNIENLYHILHEVGKRRHNRTICSQCSQVLSVLSGALSALRCSPCSQVWKKLRRVLDRIYQHLPRVHACMHDCNLSAYKSGLSLLVLVTGVSNGGALVWAARSMQMLCIVIK